MKLPAVITTSHIVVLVIAVSMFSSLAYAERYSSVALNGRVLTRY